MDNNAFLSFEPTFFDYTQGPSTNMSMSHFHRSYEIYYLISGKRRYFIEDEIFDIYPGDMILIPEMSIHKTWNTPDTNPDEQHERFLLSPKKEEIPEIFLPLFDTHFYRLTDEAKDTILSCFHSIWADSKRNDAYSAYCNHANLIKILCTLARLPVSNKHTRQFSKNDIIMQQAALYIKKNCHHALRLEDCAKKYAFSKEYFSTLFKQTIGFGFNEYLTQMRISKSMELLTSTSLPITQISATCGFNDSNYFSNVFKKTIGLSPKYFRAKYTKRAL